MSDRELWKVCLAFLLTLPTVPLLWSVDHHWAWLPVGAASLWYIIMAKGDDFWPNKVVNLGVVACLVLMALWFPFDGR